MNFNMNDGPLPVMIVLALILIVIWLVFGKAKRAGSSPQYLHSARIMIPIYLLGLNTILVVYHPSIHTQGLFCIDFIFYLHGMVFQLVYWLAQFFRLDNNTINAVFFILSIFEELLGLVNTYLSIRKDGMTAANRLSLSIGIISLSFPLLFAIYEFYDPDSWVSVIRKKNAAGLVDLELQPIQNRRRRKRSSDWVIFTWGSGFSYSILVNTGSNFWVKCFGTRSITMLFTKACCLRYWVLVIGTFSESIS